jgi:predicted branched-subunit amino acid permease
MSIGMTALLVISIIVNSIICVLVFAGVLEVCKDNKTSTIIAAGVITVVITSVLTGGGWFFIITQIFGV